jgi:hypothetical protein
MKKIAYLLTCILILSSITSCSNEEDTIAQQMPITGSMSAKINGQNWNSNVATSSMQTMNFDGINSGMLQILGTTLSGSSMSINIPVQSISTGTYTYNGIDGDGNLSYNTFGNSYFSNEQGGTFTFTISTYDTTNGTISGTFSGTLIDFSNSSDQVSITNGTFSNIKIYGQQLYSNGDMSLKLNNGSLFSMDTDRSDNKFLMIQQVNESNKIVLYGYNNNAGADKGVYSIMIPKNVTAGTYTLDGTNYDAGYTNSNNVQYTTTGGSITITSHNGNSVIGTFNFNASGNSQNVTISNGSFNITHN